ncbi:MAG: PspC domain-containing protein [Clostridia bacterium]|nr:PspC domain-containing protein [Clostridia bacterium]MBO5433860.1 PspC domain-containing protein [Clostridia bacterium]
MNGRKLYKIEHGKKVAGVCAGIAKFLNIDVTIIRLAWVLFTLAGGCGLIAYIIAALVMPNEEDVIPYVNEEPKE